MSHSPEPWKLELNEANPIRDANGLNVTIVLDGRMLDATIPAPENLQRIVACVNACKGISNEDLQRDVDTVLRPGGECMTLRTKDHPEANGRRPQYGDVQWTVRLPLEDGTELQVKMGQQSRDLLFGMLIADCHDSDEPEPEAQ